ncbi:BTAD domain-containing putative transcriptional regulator [Nocardioides bizhenqiangii]|uniref:BTAD domain-containing putative transcriptional regulator n=1 Tax=Nocardioides bizhenqiangii TaxID=3095076 RepID=A0ABZ0ZQK6_9ACTN|nr:MULTISPECIES: BTAD domain-containing putative transcriptional regulator [unclassified Nocardioides]MDZ5619453.1 BTAD domain-containing putative transcriptional regulator [Nocardioides sp. HM23]WQQ26527.1 BTAD domain-containing putative transcriptional regulator [Nocardioides sp. HM61]
MEPAFGVLGPLEVRDADGTPVSLGGQKPRELLAALLLHRGQIVTVDRLVDHLWGEAATAGAATTLRTYVGQVRKILDRAAAPATLDSRSGGYCFDTDPAAIDAGSFERLLREGQQRAAADGPAVADEVLGMALDLWRGEVLVDLGPPDFASSAVAHLNELRLVAWEGWLDAQLALGRHRAVVTRLQALVDEHPFRERFSAQLMLALYRSGRQADALAVSAATRLRLAEELGLDPGPELRDLETSMLRQSPELDATEPRPAERWTGASVSGASTSAEAHAARSLAQGHMELMEREHERALLTEAIAAAARGEGSGIAVAGDAGTGKSTLVQVACADGPRLRLLRSGCDPLSTPRPLGPLRDLAVDAGFSAVVSEDDVLLPQVCEDVLAALSTEPTVLVVEDLHWVDAATAQVLRFVARRIRSLPLALLVTYREHEIGPRHPARQLLGDMASHERLSSIGLAPLSVDGVRRLVDGTSLDAQQVHALTGGNQFFVTEIAKDPDRPLPRTVRDAVLARTADVTAEDFEVLQLLATSPDRLDDRVLPALELDLSALTRLEDTGLLTHARGGLAYRHELARQAIESTIPAGAGPGLHLRVVEGLERAGVQEPAVLTHHAVAARDSERARRYACAAAEEACRKGAHGEAVAFFQVALDHVADDDVAERAALLQRLSFEQYLTDRLGDAIDTVRATIPLWREVGDDAGVAAAHERTGMYEYYAAHRTEAEELVDRAAGLAEGTGAVVVESSARATRGFLAYLRSELDLATACASEAAEIADRTGGEFLRTRARMVELLASLATGDETARGDLEQLIRDARTEHWDELASTGYSQIVSIDVENRRFDKAAAVLEVSMPFAEERDIPICNHWQTSVRARVRHARGDWEAALADVREALGREGMAVAKLWPNLLLALTSLRRHGTPDPSALDAAWLLMRSIDEPIRRLSFYSGLAEIMWTTGTVDQRVVRDAPAELAAVAGTPGTEWATGELAAWLRRLGIPAEHGALASPYATAAEGRIDEAAGWWAENREPFTEAMVLADSTEPRHRERAVRLLEELGAHATAARVRDPAPAERR